jgi:subtilisin family serine protease
MRKWSLTLCAVFIFLLGLYGVQVQTADAGQINRSISKESTQKVEQQVLDEISANGKTTFWIVLHDKADLSPAFTIKKDKDRGDFVYKTLKSVADQSQAGLRAFLAASGVKYFPFWIANTIQVRDAGTALLNQVAARPEVEKIVADRVYPLPPVTPGTDEKTPNTTEWGLDNIQAPQVWSTFGVRGEGIVVANVDTGFQYNHPALVEKYRGNLGGGNFDHNYNWFDPSNVCGTPSNVPCDNNSHGTHTMGTMVGDDGDPGTNQIGVAPHAKFMGCKGCETNSCSDFALNTCGQFILAPTDLNGQNPDSSLRPHIVNNSWGGGPGDPFYQPVVDAWIASGIFPQFSIGNSGPSCGTGGSPGDYLNSYAAGAYGINNTIAGFSGRGPSGIDNMELKPNIAGPGVNVRSSVPTNGYGNFNGTSMASPHVAGTIALMWSAAPSLVRDIAATRAILDASATDVSDTSCGGTATDNNVWGEGRLNALAAVTQSPICNTGTLSGTVTDSVSTQPISGASITTANGPFDYSTTTDANGNYTMDVCEGSYDVTASASGYTPQTVTGLAVTAGNTTTQDFQLVAASSCIYEQDFNDATMEWLEEKPTVTQPGDGFLHLSPLKKKAIGVADPSFAGASTGTYTFDVQFTGGTDAKNWLYIARVDKKNGLEVLVKVESGKVVIKDKNGATLAKGKGTFTFAPNTPYTFVVTYNGTTVDVTINGTAVITGFTPTRTLPTANIGGAAKGNDLLIDNVCVQ